jgi:glycosyltransferase involved in cell wall biosynthesis
MITFTAIVPNYNDSATLPQTLDSLLAQTSPFNEIIVIDDGSTDTSRAIIADYAARYPVIRALPNEQNIGIIATLNKGVMAATSEFIISCSSNDWYDPQEVEYCRKALTDFPEAQMVCGNAGTWDVVRNCPGKPLVTNLPQQRQCYTPDAYVKKNKHATVYFNGGAVAMNRKQILAFGNQRAILRWHADLILYLQFAFKFSFVYVPEIFSTMRLEEGTNYSDGRFRWREQQDVTIAMLRLFHDEFPEIGAKARQAAMLPKYDFRTLLILFRPEHRWYITRLVIWRTLMHTGFYWMRRYIPRNILMAIRPYFRV